MTTTEKIAKQQAQANGHQPSAFRKLGFSATRYCICGCGAVAEVNAMTGEVSGDALSARCSGEPAKTTNRIPTFQRPPVWAR